MPISSIYLLLGGDYTHIKKHHIIDDPRNDRANHTRPVFFLHDLMY